MASSYDLVNATFRGKLPKVLKDYRARGLSLRDMATQFDRDGIEVSRMTIWRWCQQAGIDTPYKGHAK